MGRGIFLIAKQQATGLPGLGNMKAEIISEAFQFCAVQDKDTRVLSATETQPPYIFGNYPRSEISFTCTETAPAKKKVQKYATPFIPV